MNRQKSGFALAVHAPCLNRALPHKLPTVAVALTLLLVAVGRANASFDTSLLVNITPQSGGIFLYTYTANVLPTSTANLAEFDVNLNDSSLGPLSPGANISAITQPTGFINLYTTGDAFISFQSTDSSTDIQPGASGTFSFTSAAAPALQPYLFRSFDGPNIQATGQVLAPSTRAAAVPEPSGLFALGLGLAGVFGARARRRVALTK